jgi:uncharacterized protein
MLLGFSGGKDSFYLLQAGREALGPANVFAYFVTTPFIGEAAHERVAYFKKKFSLRIQELSIDFLIDARMRHNSKQRCYLCKKRMFGVLLKEARKLGISLVADGTTASDLDAHRPGRLALQKLGIQSPLQDAGFTGAEIIAELKKQGVADYFLSSSTCLATRFPYDFDLQPEQIQAIGQVEHYLIRAGIYPLRVRHLTDGVRIETEETNFKKVISLKDDLELFCRARQLKFVTLDLGGLKSGPWD